ncbi:excinuclease ABC subunit UvrA [Pseudonocardia sp. KRD-184]|uniref:Excinuclease ABC subunit UvrA n=1 Tax=Pseudonocardia oceani TaxID=2792013 RepID=A0ABS6UIB9_9PSEU|nr:excinuclease ABC subunit UvrA [Pseudonocardia oceani]MBW0090864.1 excinuclease ABC subunit UvrA [Pseudonocardia oceani]MBW0096674.1 excinuclease ABC subunit UvrA [Pseudonocardia oceani]MBW0110532.1 excinuclease ABC subunit UvrA [Pseudonocardia oceani]MBW0122106.1 excinuclease ABC subunit UvrA [Pseudonocardia oceani]MBW0131992.1 excinuclease ABC subunit UvrA [Pseudonocardia oceani]
MTREFITVTGARENNLREVSVRIPKRAITAFVGASGSGKSSLVFDTIAAEAQRQLNETFSAFVRGFLPRLGQPDADLIENLSTAIVVDQKRLGGGSRSTLGTVTDINPALRLLFSRRSTPYVGPRNAFGFNDPAGMCPTCGGVGRKVALDHAVMFDRSKSLNEGAILHRDWAVDSWYWHVHAQSGRFDMDKPLHDYTDAEWQELLFGSGGKVAVAGPGKALNLEYVGVEARFNRAYIDVEETSSRKKEVIARYTTSIRCPDCDGTRLAEGPRTATVAGHTLPALCSLDLVSLHALLPTLRDDATGPVVDEAVARIAALIDMGLSYLTLDRETSTLSGGESQRIKMVRHLGSSLVDVMYVFDEPTIGLHPRDVGRMNDLLHRLRDKGNTVLVVEHDTDVITRADHVVELGPRAGTEGGRIVYEGGVAGLETSGTLTGEFLHRPVTVREAPRTPTGHLRVTGAKVHNLRGFDVDVPLGVLVAVTGVAGSGKSTLVREVLVPQHPDTIVVDQSAVATSSRSTPATWTGVMDPIRKLYAKANGVKPALFSFNSEGACPTCNGIGAISSDLAYLDGVRSTCTDCEGRRYTDAVLALTVDGKSISDALDMTAAQALEFFDAKEITKRLASVVDVGLGYLTLGQPLSTLSGGECQRLKLANRLHEKGTVFVLDEPTTGLHMSDCGHLLGLLDRLVDGGSSVIVVEHNLDVIAHADWVIDLGPDGGDDGGTIVFEGPPSALLRAPGSFTGEHLARHIARHTG